MAPGSHFTIPGLNTDETYRTGERTVRVAVEGWNERVVEGALLDFQSGSGIKVLPDGHAKALALRFNQIKRLRFAPTEPVTAPASGFADEALQTFAVQLRDGSVYAGHCHGCRRTPDGLWVFPKVAAEGDPQRVFIPRSAITNYQVQRGDGGLLVDSDFGATLWQEGEETPVEALRTNPPAPPVATLDQLQEALRRQATLKPVPIGEALLGLGKITPDQLAAALQRQKSTGTPLGQTLVEMGLIQPADLQVALARKMGYPFVDVRRYPVDPAALRLVPLALATRLRVLPIALVGGALVVAMADPLQFKAIDELEFTAQRKVLPVVGTAADLQARIGEAYRQVGLADGPAAPEMPAGGAPEVEAWQLAAALAVEPAGDGAEERPIEQSDNTLVKLVNTMIVEAFHQRASDIHIEPYPGRDKVVIRFRVDGEMRPYLELPSSYRNALVARIKVMCDLDIAERRKPQDGKIHFKRFGGLPIELRVATIPTAHGLEDVVMRILQSSATLPLHGLHLSARNLAAIEHILERPYGLFLCAGPTGSGKTTTLHAALQRLNTPNRKIWTAEDPVEITQRGLRQIQVNPKIGWTFANALRALLRADPDVIMVGEIRDPETAEMAIEASLTGHFVMSTLHTNSAAETVLRLHDLGVDPFSFADSLQGILAQRLVRRVCPACVQHEPLSPARLAELRRDYQAQLPPDHPLRDDAALEAHWREHFSRDGALMISHAPGCAECGQTGYRGRLALHELLAVTPAVRQLVQTRAQPAQIQAQGIHDGMRTLRQDGIEKVLMGLTTLAEVRASSNL
ncbi:Type II secretion system protein E [Tepidimonas sediminis]|uniref:Type II secretion system protein E n=1 Tax=Tepidimonas sediminis TaxID=2588941 RepID=A0A554WPK6_9BURK|nr:GspE/PulE family protein [Tepidimonas sediminis]TSE25509.1 Type II secretion system protein E [Tepidimonas sediminis]